MAPTPRRITFDDAGTVAATAEAEAEALDVAVDGNRHASRGGGGGINDVEDVDSGDEDDDAPEVVSTKTTRSTALDRVNQQSELAKRERKERREKQSQRELQGRERNLTKAASARVGLAQDVFEEAERLRRAKEEEEATAAAAAEAARSKQRQKRRHLRSSDLDALTGDLAQEVKVGGFSVVPLPAVLERRRPLSKAALRFQKLKNGAAKVRRMPAVKTIARPSDGPAPMFVSGKKSRRR